MLTETKYIAAARIDGNSGDYGVGDNSNVLAMTELQYAPRSIARWDFQRGSDATSKCLDTTLEGYYGSMVGSMGIKSSSVASSKEFNEVMVNKLTEQRDAVSAVSLDEEMINMMKYQHAFSVASKLLSVADEMLSTLIAAR